MVLKEGGYRRRKLGTVVDVLQSEDIKTNTLSAQDVSPCFTLYASDMSRPPSYRLLISCSGYEVRTARDEP